MDNTMKLAHLLPIVAAIAFAVSAAFGVESATEEIKLRYVMVSDLYGVIKAVLGSSDASAVIYENVSANSLGVDPANPGAKKVRVLIAELDRPSPASH